MRFSILLFLLIFSSGSLWAQIAQEDLFTYDAQEAIYEKELSFSFKLHTNGFGVAINKGKFVDYYKQKLWQLEFMEIKHPKETRQQSLKGVNQQSSKSFKFGKSNNFYNLNFSLGTRKLLTEKAEKSGVAVSLFYAGGLSLGILKPYYLELLVEDPETTRLLREHHKFSDEIAPVFLNPDRIVGTSGIAYGWDESKLLPGLQGKIGINFDWAALDEYMKSVELGFMINAYYKRPSILVIEDNNFLFANLYLKMVLGKRS